MTGDVAPMISAVGEEPYFREVCEHLGAGLIVADTNLIVRVWNAAAARIFESDASRMIGKSATSIFPRQRQKFAMRLLRQAVDEGQVSELEFQLADQEGSLHEMISIIGPVVGQTPEQSGASICVVDITRRIGLHAEQHEARKMTALSEMSAAVAHHFNNILGGLVTSIDFAANCTDPAMLGKLLGQMNTAILRATALVNGLLAFSRGEQRVDDLSDLTEVINETAEEVDRMRAGRHIEFDLKIPQLPIWPVPRVQLTTILRNIAQNAVQAMPSGGRMGIEITFDDAFATIAISDTGIGLSEEAKARIFEPFWTTRGGATQVGGSTGMGLAIAHGLAKVIGATITVRSQLGKGSTFVVTVPRPATP